MRHGFTGERVDTRKPARGGFSGGVFSHVGTCENLHLVEPGGAAIYLCLRALFRGFQSVFVRILDLVYFTKCPVDIMGS